MKGDGAAWAVAIAALVLAGIGTFVKYSIPKRKLNEVGIPNRTLLIATAVAIVGLFAIPVVGAPIGFVLAIYVNERLRVGRTKPGRPPRPVWAPLPPRSGSSSPPG